MHTIIHTPEPTSSPALYVGEMVEALTAAGARIIVVCPADHDALAAFRRNPRVIVRESGARRIDPQASFLGKIWANARFIASSCAVLFKAAEKGDVVNFQYVMHLPFCGLFFACARIRGCRIVFTAHDPLPHKWLLPKFLRWIEKGTLGWIYRQSDAIAVHSRAGKRAILANFKVPESKIEVIVHGPYKLNTVVPQKSSSDILDLLLFGAIRENKGLDLAIKAVQNLHRTGVKVRLTIAGRVLNRKEQAYWHDCRTLINTCPKPIRLIERFIPDGQLPTLFAAHDCFLLPYRNFHSDSGVAFMALANSRPFIATDAGGLGQMIRDSKAGLLIHSPCVPAVEAAIRGAVALGPARLREMGVCGETWVMQECGWMKAASQMQAIFTAVAAGEMASSAIRPEDRQLRSWEAASSPDARQAQCEARTRG